ncbi:hypothetical protein NHE_0795 [Neorickettsia helminthoeca str. Oregon]|uniref:Uncharacterized protein n=1 Tax=Neorickettsia helminthoeca str. Oregon TaxID=1286528 RepID=X5H564_9RICK|nr:hypothetical protein NHE_0795 [Neorickettsia helminthoeca str. Oregon]
MSQFSKRLPITGGADYVKLMFPFLYTVPIYPSGTIRKAKTFKLFLDGKIITKSIEIAHSLFSQGVYY